MFKFRKFSDLLEHTSSGFRAIIAAIVLLGAVLTSLTTVRALLALPARFDAHRIQTQTQTEILRTQLCITVADHRKMDWTLCYTNPTAVTPN